MPFRPTRLASVIILTGCGAAATPTEPLELASSESAFVGTWRWSGSGTKLGTIALGEEHMIFRTDGTYTVVSKSGDGLDECYEGTFAWRPSGSERRSGVMIFNASYERETYLDDTDTLHFSAAGTYVKSSAVITTRCP
ncbi:MAG: hypothetical protein JST00_40365 [Deltaproteobacteria bacterium]|nr:hypothetical protein [Deltaproteobacteria bacterium]